MVAPVRVVEAAAADAVQHGVHFSLADLLPSPSTWAIYGQCAAIQNVPVICLCHFSTSEARPHDYLV